MCAINAHKKLDKNFLRASGVKSLSAKDFIITQGVTKVRTKSVIPFVSPPLKIFAFCIITPSSIRTKRTKTWVKTFVKILNIIKHFLQNG